VAFLSLYGGQITHADTLKGALVQLCERASHAWKEAAKNGSDAKMERAQRLSMVVDELARAYEDAIGDVDEVVDAQGNASGLASDVMCEWEWDEISKGQLSSLMLECAQAYAGVANRRK
jgi:hypothetical protein